MNILLFHFSPSSPLRITDSWTWTTRTRPHWCMTPPRTMTRITWTWIRVTRSPRRSSLLVSCPTATTHPSPLKPTTIRTTDSTRPNQGLLVDPGANTGHIISRIITSTDLVLSSLRPLASRIPMSCQRSICIQVTSHRTSHQRPQWEGIRRQLLQLVAGARASTWPLWAQMTGTMEDPQWLLRSIAGSMSSRPAGIARISNLGHKK